MGSSLRRPCRRWELHLLKAPPSDGESNILHVPDDFALHVTTCADCETALHDYQAIGHVLATLPSPELPRELPAILRQTWAAEDAEYQQNAIEQPALFAKPHSRGSGSSNLL